MARGFRLLSVIWLISACLALSTAATTTEEARTPTTTPAATTTAAQTTAIPTTTPAATTTAAQTTAVPTTTPAATTTAAQTTAVPTTTPAATTTAAQTTAVPTTTPAATTTAAQTTAVPTTTPAATTTAAQTTAVPNTTPAATTTAAQTTAVPTTTPAATTTAAETTAATTPDGGEKTTKPVTTPDGGEKTTKPVTTPDGGENTTKPVTTPDGGEKTTKPVTTPDGGEKTTKPTVPDPCKPNPCGDGITCEARFEEYFCVCPVGSTYNEGTKSCDIAKVYPGELSLPNIEYSDALKNKESKEFQEESSKVIDELKKAFKDNKDYIGSTVLSFSKKTITPARSRTTEGVVAEVENIFENTATYSDAEISNTVGDYIATATDDSALAGGTIEAGDLCVRGACDETSTKCDAKPGSFVCSCKTGYIATQHSTSLCIACASGKKPNKDSSSCVDCSFGYSGFNCDESWQLILVVVGSVFGALLLILVTALAVVARRPAKKKQKKSKEENGTSVSAKAPLVTSSTAYTRETPMNGSANAYASAGVPRIPRATTTNSPDRRTNLEMTPSINRQNLGPAGRNPRLYDDPDDLNPYARAPPQSSNYAQSKPQNNPYAQTRPQSNPYASNQGYANPYYKHDNGRPLY